MASVPKGSDINWKGNKLFENITASRMYCYIKTHDQFQQQLDNSFAFIAFQYWAKQQLLLVILDAYVQLWIIRMQLLPAQQWIL